jgi:hypothetical protein
MFSLPNNQNNTHVSHLTSLLGVLARKGIQFNRTEGTQNNECWDLVAKSFLLSCKQYTQDSNTPRLD